MWRRGSPTEFLWRAVCLSCAILTASLIALCHALRAVSSVSSPRCCHFLCVFPAPQIKALHVLDHLLSLLPLARSHATVHASQLDEAKGNSLIRSRFGC